MIHSAAVSSGLRPAITPLLGEPTEPMSIQEHHAVAREGPIQVRLTFDEAAGVAGASA